MQTGAKKLGVSPATLMRSIRDLERELGTALIERSGSSIVLTRVGRTFAARAGAAHRELNRARDEILQKLGALTGSVSVGIAAAALQRRLSRALSHFREESREVQLKLVETSGPDAGRQLRDGVVDLYVGPVGPWCADDLSVAEKPALVPEDWWPLLERLGPLRTLALPEPLRPSANYRTI